MMIGQSTLSTLSSVVIGQLLFDQLITPLVVALFSINYIRLAKIYLVIKQRSISRSSSQRSQPEDRRKRMNRQQQSAHVTIPMPATIENPGSILGLTMYKIALVLLYTLVISRSYGIFTNGLPPRFTWVYVTSWLYGSYSHLRGAYINLWIFTQIFKEWTLTNTALAIRHNQFYLWLVFGLIIFFIAEIAVYHTS